MEELIARLRAVSETGCDPDLPHEAADAIEVLARQTEEFEQLAVARGHTINGLRSELSAVKVERDALAAKLKELEGQEPVAWRKRIEFENGSEEWKFCAFPVLSKAEPLFARPVPAEPVNARLLDIATGQLQHSYSENCPDPVSRPNSRDPECPACQAIVVAEAEREACLRCYSPDDTADDWADAIRARGEKP